MLTFRTVPRRARIIIFVALAVADLASRFAVAMASVDRMAFGTSHEVMDMTSIATATGVLVPLVAAPLLLAPLAFITGQAFVLHESRWVRLVSAFFMVASFLLVAVAPAISVMAAGLAYLILVSGMLKN